jgi:hypothetical protein
MNARKLLISAAFAILFVCGSLSLFIAIRIPLNYYDEGLTLLNATRVMQGDIPYHDFWTLYAPGHFYALAALFRVVGPDVLAARVLDTVCRIALALLVYWVGKGMTSRWAAVGPYALVTLWLGAIGFYSYPIFPALAFCLSVLLSLFRYFDTGRRRWLALAGMLAGMAAIVRLDFGAYAILGTAIGVLVFHIGQAGADDARVGQRIRAAAKAGLLFAAGVAIVAVPVYGYLILKSGFGEVWSDLILFPATTFRAMRALPKPTLIPDWTRFQSESYEDWVRFYLPLAIYGASVVVAIGSLIRSRHRGANRPATQAAQLMATAGMGAGLFLQATGRYEALHVLPSSILAALAAGALLYRIPMRQWARRGWVRPIAFAVPLAALACLALARPYVLHFTELLGSAANYQPLGCLSSAAGFASSLQRAGCIPVGPDQTLAVEFIRARTRPDEAIFVGNPRHDRIVVNDLGFYFLADRRCPTRYCELHPGVATTLPVQREIVQNLVSKSVRWVVIARVWDPSEPNASAISSGVTVLDEFIRANYAPLVEFGDYQIWRSRN